MAREKNMYYDLPDMGFIKIQGNDAKKFLQGQLTCDVESVTSEQSCMGAHCNPQGRIISLFYLFLFNNNYYMLMPANMISIAISALIKYAVFFKVELSDASQELAILGCDQDAPFALPVTRISVAQHHSRFVLAGTPATINTIRNQVTSPSDISSSNSWKYLNILDGIPEIYRETSTKFLPHELNLDKLNAISFNKGCYTGQEIIARMHYRGKLKNRMYVTELFSTHPLEPGTDIDTLSASSEWSGGTIVDACNDVYNNKYHVLLVANEQMRREI